MALKPANHGVGEKVRIHVSSCSLSVRNYGLYMALKSAGQGIGEKVRIMLILVPSSCSPQVSGSGCEWKGENPCLFLFSFSKRLQTLKNLKSAGQGAGEKVRIHAYSCSLSVRDYNL